MSVEIHCPGPYCLSYLAIDTAETLLGPGIIGFGFRKDHVYDRWICEVCRYEVSGGSIEWLREKHKDKSEDSFKKRFINKF